MAEEEEKQLNPTSNILLSGSNTLRKWNGTGWEEINTGSSAEEKVDDKGNGVHSKMLDYIGIPKAYGDQLYSGLMEDVQVFTATTSETASTFYSLVNWLCGRSEDKTKASSSKDEADNGETPENPVEEQQEQMDTENNENFNVQEIEPSIESSQEADALPLSIHFPEETEPIASLAIPPPDEFKDGQNPPPSSKIEKRTKRLYSAPATHVDTISNNIGLQIPDELPPLNLRGDLQRTGSRVRFASSPALLQHCDHENRQPDENDNNGCQITPGDPCPSKIVEHPTCSKHLVTDGIHAAGLCPSRIVEHPHPSSSQHLANFTDVIHAAGSRVRFAANMVPNVGQPLEVPQGTMTLTLPKLEAPITEANNNPISPVDFTNVMRPSSSSNGNKQAPGAPSDDLNQDLKTLENIIKKLYKNINKKGPLIIVANFKPKSDGDFQVEFGSPNQKPLTTLVPSTKDTTPKQQQSLNKPVPPSNDKRDVRTPTPVPINHISSSRMLFEIENPPSDYDRPYYAEESGKPYEDDYRPHSVIHTSEEDEDVRYSGDHRKHKYDNNDYPISKEDDYQSEAFEEDSSSAKEDDNYYSESRYGHRRGKKEQFNTDNNRNHGVQPQVTKITHDMMAMMLRDNPINVESIVNVTTTKTNNFQRQASLIPTFPTRQSDITSKGQAGLSLRERSSASHSFQQPSPSKQQYRTVNNRTMIPSSPQRQNSYRELFKERQTKGQIYHQKTIYVDLTTSASKSSSFH